jgi:hypothetical protein
MLFSYDLVYVTVMLAVPSVMSSTAASSAVRSIDCAFEIAGASESAKTVKVYAFSPGPFEQGGA